MMTGVAAHKLHVTSVVASSTTETCAYPNLHVEVLHAGTPDDRVAGKKIERTRKANIQGYS